MRGVSLVGFAFLFQVVACSQPAEPNLDEEDTEETDKPNPPPARDAAAADRSTTVENKNDAREPSVPPADAAVTPVVDAAVVADAQGPPSADAAPPSVAQPIRSVGVGPFAVCIADDAGKVTCFGRTTPPGAGGSRDQAPADLALMVAVSGHHVGACAILKTPPASDQAVRCWGLGFTKQPPPRIADPVFLTSGDHHACALSSSGAVTCWGVAGHQSPQGLRAKQIASLAFDCAVNHDDRVVCWGPANVPMPPAGLAAKRVATGGHYDGRNNFACAIKLDDSVTCWGASPAAVPAGLEAKDIAAGSTAACAIRTDGSVVCWGNIAKPPAGLQPLAIFMSYGTAVAVNPDGRLVYWGDLRDGKATPPDVRAAVR